MTSKKTTRNALFSSVMALLLCCSMLLGTTFAWFTDSVTSTGNIIKSGTLDVEMSWSDTKDGTYKDASKGAIFNYDLWEPGFTQVKYVKIENVGTLAFKYQLNIVPDVKPVPGQVNLADVIDVYMVPVDGAPANRVAADQIIATGNGTALSELMADPDGAAYGAMLAKDGDIEIEDLPADLQDITVEGEVTYCIILHMQEEAGNEYQDLSVGEGFSVQLLATQLTAEIDSFGPDYDKDATTNLLDTADVIATPETIDEILADVEANTVIGLSDGYYDKITLTQDNLTLVANNAVVGFLNLNAHDGIMINGLTFDVSGAQQTYTFASGNNQTATGYTANITGDTNSPESADNIVIKNCTFTNTSGVAAAAVDNYAPIYFNEQGAATERASDITIDSCVFACNATNYIALNYLSEGEVFITNNTFGGGSYGTAHNTINATGNAADWTIAGNEFNNWNTEKTAIGSSKNGSNNVSWTITGNEFNNDDGAVVLALKTSYSDANSDVTFKNNTVLNGNGNIVTTDVNAENETVYAGHKIQLNGGSVFVASADALIAALATGDDVSLTADIKIDPANMSNAYGTTGLNIKEGQTINGNGYTLDIKGAGGTWDSGINTTGGVIKNLTVTGSFRGIFINHNSDHSEPVVLENVIIDGTTYTISCDQGLNQTLEATNSTFNGWTSYAKTLGKAKFVDCRFGEGNGYAYCRPYAPTEFVGCDFADGYEMDAVGTVTFENCTLGGVPLTAGNLATLVTSNTANASVK